MLNFDQKSNSLTRGGRARSRALRFLLAAIAVHAWGCAEAVSPESKSAGLADEPSVKRPSEALRKEESGSPGAKGSGSTERRQQGLIDEGGNNWVVLSDSAYGTLVGPDGEANDVLGRLVNFDRGVLGGSANVSGLLLVGREGGVALVNEEGMPLLASERTALDGRAIRFAALGRAQLSGGGVNDEVWLVGGEGGQLELLDTQGEPAGAQAQQRKLSILEGVELTAGAFASNGIWYVGTEDGQIAQIRFDSDSLSFINPPTATDSPPKPFGDQPITGVVSKPDRLDVLVTGLDRFAVYPGGQVVVLSRPQGTTLPESGEPNPFEITRVVYEEGRVGIGTRSGHVAVYTLRNSQGTARDFSLVPANLMWRDALEGRAVRDLAFNGSEWLVVGGDGYGRTLSDLGLPQGELEQLGPGDDLSFVYWNGMRWLVGTEESSFLINLNPDLSLPVEYESVLGSTTAADDVEGPILKAAAFGAERVLVAGASGAYRLLNAQGMAVGEVKRVQGEWDIHGAGWNGEQFLVAGAGGQFQLIDTEGNTVGEARDVLSGKTIHAVGWTGAFWFLGGEDGYFRRLLPDGKNVGEIEQLSGFQTLYGAQWNGRVLMVVGTSGTAGVYQLLNSGGMAASELGTVAQTEALYAMDWSGTEWLVGGGGGIVRVISSGGTPRENLAATDVFFGRTIYSLRNNREHYLIGGEDGLIRRIKPVDLLPLDAPMATNAFDDVEVVLWTLERGFGGGPCFSETNCYTGACIGGFLSGVCCESSCQGPCVSCSESDTGQPDGICAPTPAGMPLFGKECAQDAPESCGLTGLCNGEGECGFYEQGTACGEAICAGATYQAQSTCDGLSECISPEPISCAPYQGCDENGCLTQCSGESDCIEGYICEGAECVEAMTPEPTPEPNPEPSTPGDDEDGGGCQTTSTSVVGPHGLAFALFGLGLLVFLRRSRRFELRSMRGRKAMK